MFKLIVLLLGTGVGAGGATAFYLTEPKDWIPQRGGSPGNALQEVKARFLDALAEGKRQGAATEVHMRSQLDTYRKRSDRPSVTANR